MAQDLQVNLLSPAKVVARGRATHVLIPGSEGYLGVLPGHARLVGELGTGELIVEDGQGKKDRYFLSGGYVDVSQDSVTVLADVLERPGDIDKQRAERAKSRALDRLDKKVGIDVQRAQAALLRATSRLTISSGGI